MALTGGGIFNKKADIAQLAVAEPVSLMNADDQKREIEALAKMREQNLEQLRKLWSKYEGLEGVLQAAERNDSSLKQERRARISE